MKKELNKVIKLLNEIESQTQEGDFREIEEFEELKRKVKPKMVVATRALTELVNIFRAFLDKHQNSKRTVFSLTLEFYLDALKFDP
jgi:hypothetical protein